VTEIFANKLLCNLFKLDRDIPEWGKWIAMDHDGEVGVFEFSPIIKLFHTHNGVWNSKEIKGKVTKYKLLFWLGDTPFPELQLISVEDLLST